MTDDDTLTALATNSLVYLRARYYRPALGVFPSLDPLEMGNRYQYVGGNVINRVDPSGLFGWGLFATEQGDYCYCIGREGGVPEGLLENFAIWMKNNNPGDAFMPDTPGQRYWLYPGKTLTIPDSFMGITNIHDTGLWKRNGCHCPASVNQGRCNVTINSVIPPAIDTCQCPEGQRWDPLFQTCVPDLRCPSGELRYPEQYCPGASSHYPTQPGPRMGGQIAPSEPPNCDLLRPLNPQIHGIVTDWSVYTGGGGGVSVYAMTDDHEIAIYFGAEGGSGLSFDVVPFLEAILSPFVSSVILGDDPWNIYSEADLDSFAGSLSESFSLDNLSVGGRFTIIGDFARYSTPDCVFTDIRGWDVALGGAMSVSSVWEIMRVPNLTPFNW
jgi:hypothetical protein